MGLGPLVGGAPSAKLGAAIGASVLLHAGLLGSLDHLIGGAAVSGPRQQAPLRARIVPHPTEPAIAVAYVPPVAPRAAPARRASELAAADALPLLPGPRFFEADELDQRPLPLSNITLDYPEGVRPRDVHVVARLLIDEQGRAEHVQILSGGEDGFNRLVVQAFGGASYRPGMKGGRPVRSQMTVEVKFAFGEPVAADSLAR